MRRRYVLPLATASLLGAIPAHANIVIACGGYSPSINDHVEWDMTITGAQADWGEGPHFKATETKGFYILTRPGTEIRINKAAKSYVTYGPRRQKARAIEWSRKVPGEGCEIPKIGSRP
jgi:hypothetical protein